MQVVLKCDANSLLLSYLGQRLTVWHYVVDFILLVSECMR